MAVTHLQVPAASLTPYAAPVAPVDQTEAIRRELQERDEALQAIVREHDQLKAEYEQVRLRKDELEAIQGKGQAVANLLSFTESETRPPHIDIAHLAQGGTLGTNHAHVQEVY